MIPETQKTIFFVGGPDVSLRVELLKLLQSEGYKLCVVGTNEREKGIFETNGILFFHYSLKRRYFFFSNFMGAWQLYSIFRKEKPYIIHAFDTIPTIVGRIVARVAGVPIIIGTIPGMGSLFSYETVLNKLLRVIYIFGQKMASTSSHITIFQNVDDFNFFISKRIVPKSKATIIKGSGVDVEKFSSRNLDAEKLAKLQTDMGLNANKLNITMVSRMVEYKGVKDFLEAARISVSRHDNLQFNLVGPLDDTVAAVPEREIKKYDKVVKYWGPRGDIKEILHLSDIVVLPTYYREGVPRILLEAASMEKPIITTNVPGCKDIVEDGVNGLIVPIKNPSLLASAVEKLVLDESLRKRMGELSRRKVVKEFSLEIVFKETLGIYQKAECGRIGNISSPQYNKSGNGG
jgi:glycosyltransferase involved in cell wall biosynthesis